MPRHAALARNLGAAPYCVASHVLRHIGALALAGCAAFAVGLDATPFSSCGGKRGEEVNYGAWSREVAQSAGRPRDRRARTGGLPQLKRAQRVARGRQRVLACTCMSPAGFCSLFRLLACLRLDERCQP